MSHTHEAGWAHASGALRGPSWLREPSDPNELVQQLWSRTATKADGVLSVGGVALLPAPSSRRRLRSRGRADMVTLCAMLRIPVDMHNVEPADIFRPTLWDRFGGDDFRACAALGPLYA